MKLDMTPRAIGILANESDVRRNMEKVLKFKWDNYANGTAGYYCDDKMFISTPLSGFQNHYDFHIEKSIHYLNEFA